MQLLPITASHIPPSAAPRSAPRAPRAARATANRRNALIWRIGGFVTRMIDIAA